MSKLQLSLLAAGLCFGVSAAVAQNADSEQDKAKSKPSIEQKDRGATGQTEDSKFQAGKPQQSEADRGEKGRDEIGEKKQFEHGKPDQSEATQEQNAPTQSKQR